MKMSTKSFSVFRGCFQIFPTNVFFHNEIQSCELVPPPEEIAVPITASLGKYPAALGNIAIVDAPRGLSQH